MISEIIVKIEEEKKDLAPKPVKPITPEPTPKPVKPKIEPTPTQPEEPVKLEKPA